MKMNSLFSHGIMEESVLQTTIVIHFRQRQEMLQECLMVEFMKILIYTKKLWKVMNGRNFKHDKERIQRFDGSIF